MSGHNKWSSIKHKKGAADAKKGKIFSKVVKEITVAARIGGGDPNTNPRLRAALAKSKEANMPADNIERAIKKGTGELPGVAYEEQMYEGFAAGGVALLVEAVTDNKNRASSEIRTIFSRHNGNLGGSGSVAWMFNKKGIITVDKNAGQEDNIFTIATEAGADDFKVEEDSYEIISAPSSFEQVKEALANNKIAIKSSDITFLPQNYMQAPPEEARKVLALINALEDHEDVQNVYSNFDISDELMAELEKEA